jgi:hypothetical protein
MLQNPEMFDKKGRGEHTDLHLFTQWNSLKKTPVKKISRLRSQDKKAPKFSRFIKIILLRNFPLKK